MFSFFPRLKGATFFHSDPHSQCVYQLSRLCTELKKPLNGLHQTSPSSCFILLVFWLSQQAAEPLQHSLKIWIDHRPAGFKISHHDKTFWWFSDSYSCVKNESVCIYYSQTLFANNVHEDCSYVKNWLRVFIKSNCNTASGSKSRWNGDSPGFLRCDTIYTVQ